MDGYYISEDKSKLQIDKIFRFISNAYWGGGRTLEEVKLAIDSSLCFGIYSHDNDQIGFGRVVTDYSFFGYFSDVIIFEKYQNCGYGKILIAHMQDHPVMKKLRTIALKTLDAHTLYEKYGFDKIGDSPIWMSIERQKLL